MNVNGQFNPELREYNKRGELDVRLCQLLTAMQDVTNQSYKLRRFHPELRDTYLLLIEAGEKLEFVLDALRTYV